METLSSYRVVAVSRNGQRLVLDESLALDRAEQMRQLLVQTNAYQEILVEQDVADETPRATIDDGTETVAV